MQQLELNATNLSRAAVKIGCDLLRGCGQRMPGANMVISPMSAYFVLAMLACGAHGETQMELASVLGWRNQDALQINNAISSLDQSVRGAAHLLSVANAMFPGAGLHVLPQFEYIMREFFVAEVLPVDYAYPQHVANINNWVNDKTAGKIAQLLGGPLPADTAMVLLNAVHFKGIWTQPFSEDKTYPDRFNLADGNQVMVKMMHKTGSTLYFDDQYCQGVCLPYQDVVGMQPRFEAVIVLPRPGVQIDTLIGDYLVEWLMRPASSTFEINLHLPHTRAASTQML
ncbi:MAG: serpin family protein, partial [Terriglobales bacterium]